MLNQNEYLIVDNLIQFCRFILACLRIYYILYKSSSGLINK